MILLIDCPYVCHKVRYGMRDVDLLHEGIHTEVIFGFLKTFLMICKRYPNINEYVFCWDSRKSWRRKIYPEYKANRIVKEKTPVEEEFDRITFDQFKSLRCNVLPKMGFVNNFIQTGIEADDIIASVMSTNPSRQFMIVSSDADLYQLLWHRCIIHNLHTRKTIDEDKFMKNWNIKPEDWSLAKAIGGCSTDNVKGVKGVADPAKSVKSKALAYIRKELSPKSKIYQRITSPDGGDIIKRNLRLVHLPFERTQNFKLTQRTLWRRDFKDVFEYYGFESFLKQNEFREWEYALNLY